MPSDLFAGATFLSALIADTHARDRAQAMREGASSPEEIHETSFAWPRAADGAATPTPQLHH